MSPCPGDTEGTTEGHSPGRVAQTGQHAAQTCMGATRTGWFRRERSAGPCTRAWPRPAGLCPAAHLESKASAFCCAFVDRGRPLWPWPNDLLHRPFSHLAGGRVELLSAAQAPRGQGDRQGGPWAHLLSGPLQWLRLAPRAAAPGPTLWKERLLVETRWEWTRWHGCTGRWTRSPGGPQPLVGRRRHEPDSSGWSWGAPPCAQGRAVQERCCRSQCPLQGRVRTRADTAPVPNAQHSPVKGKTRAQEPAASGVAFNAGNHESLSQLEEIRMRTEGTFAGHTQRREHAGEAASLNTQMDRRTDIAKVKPPQSGSAAGLRCLGTSCPLAVSANCPSRSRGKTRKPRGARQRKSSENGGDAGTAGGHRRGRRPS